jgi:hypothetical protein
MKLTPPNPSGQSRQIALSGGRRATILEEATVLGSMASYRS